MEKLESNTLQLKVGVILLLSLVIINCSYAQVSDGIGIGTTGVHTSAILQIGQGTDDKKGVLFPVMTATTRTALTTAKDGLIVYDEDEHVLYQKNAEFGAWLPLGSVPKGIIVMWSGAVAPDGWALCNGTGDTPDLRGRFIVGYHPGDTDYDNPGNISTGGTTKGNRAGDKDVTLTEAQMPSHNHSASSGGSHSHGVTDNGHVHQQRVNKLRTLEKGTSGDRSYSDPNVYEPETPLGDVVNNYSSTTGISINSAGTHNHTIGNAGSGVAHENRPPYYTLAYIMKL